MAVYMMRLLLAAGIAMVGSHAGYAGDCNIADVLFGKTRVELLHGDGYDTGIIFGNDFDSDRFRYGNILGQIAGSERDGSRRVTDTKQNLCGVIEKNLRISTEDASCQGCSKAPIKLQRLDSGYAVTSGSSIQGTLEGKLPK